ncbi:MAG: site-specific integrase [Limisphaerales bacterium]
MSDNPSQWKKTPAANLVRYEPSGIYFARVRVGGKLIRQSLKTDVLSVAHLRLGDLVKAEREHLEARTEAGRGKLTFDQAVEIYRKQVVDHPKLKPSAKLYRQKSIDALVKTWPGPTSIEARKISEKVCQEWAASFVTKYSSSVYNNTVGTLRQILAIAVSAGARYGNPALGIKKARITLKKLKLPEQAQFRKFVHKIERAGAWCSRDCADLVRFLAYGGFRKTEAANVTWADCDFAKGEITVRGDPVTGTKSGAIRTIPMISEMRSLLERLKAAATGVDPSANVMRVRECQRAMDKAAKAVGMARITHHDLRHLFATRCIESGVDIPTVSRWLGHKDGGALAMKVYGHLRDQHSQTMAGKVKF